MKSNQSAGRLHQFISILAATLVAVTLLTAIPNGHAQEARDSWDFGWVDEFGTPEGAGGGGTAVDATGVYVSGFVLGALPGQSSVGRVDAYVRKYDFNGQTLWTRQFGSPASDAGNGIVSDTTGVYVSGNTTGALPGQVNAGRNDVFVRKYDADGNVVWTTEFGTPDIDVVFVRGITRHTSGLYLAGYTFGTFPGAPAGTGYDVFLARLDLVSGNIVWVRQFGVRNLGDSSFIGGVSVDDTGIYVATTLNPDPFSKPISQTPPGVQIAVLRKYNFDGNLLWSREFPNGVGCFATYWDVAARAGKAYVVGQWSESYLNDPQRCTPTAPGDSGVGVLQSFDADGNLLWTRRIKASDSKFTGAKNVSVSEGGIFVGANVQGSFAGHLLSGPKSDHCSALRFGGNSFFNSLDAYLRRYDFDGNVIWTHQFGSPVLDVVNSSAADTTSVYAVGDTDCRIADSVNFSSDGGAAFAVRMSLNPTSPSGLIQLVIGRLETLNDKGRFTPGQFNSLVNTLEATLSAIDHGDASGAKQLMQTFIEKVQSQRDAGTISSAEAAPLINGANSVIAAL